MEQSSYDDEILLFRYLDNDMTPEERTKFEASLKKSKTLREELEFERRLHQLGKSVNAGIEKYENEKKIEDKEFNAIIERAKENCKSYESGSLKTKGILLHQGHGMEETGNNETYRAEEDKVKRMFSYKWVAAAAVIVFVSFVTLWYFQNPNQDQTIANKNEINSSSKLASKNQDNKVIERKALPTNPDPNTGTSPAQSNNSRSTAILSDSNPAKTLKKRPLVLRPALATASNSGRKKSQPNLSFQERLIAKHFAPDNLPSTVPDFLEDASADYKDNKYEKAIKGYKEVIAEIKDVENSGVISRGNQSKIELTLFYAHYYIAQCYMSTNNTANNNLANAIQEFENAITKAPDEIWKSKAQWYQALAYLKTGQIQKAETLLERIRTNEQANEYKQKAIKLIQELKK